jgi:hypothetical protein
MIENSFYQESGMIISICMAKVYHQEVLLRNMTECPRLLCNNFSCYMEWFSGYIGPTPSGYIDPTPSSIWTPANPYLLVECDMTKRGSILPVLSCTVLYCTVRFVLSSGVPVPEALSVYHIFLPRITSP